MRGGTPTPTGFLRSGAVMALGTLASRVTGLARTLVLAAALGTQLLGDAYITANTIPFSLYDLMLGGLMTGVLVPLLIKRRRGDEDDGRATEQRLCTVLLIALTVLTAAAIACAPWLMRLYADGFTPAQADVSVLLARWLLAQVFLVGVSGLCNALLNARGRFGVAAWAPVLNNLVVVAIGTAFFLAVGPGAEPEQLSGQEIALLGAGTVAGMLIQVVVLVVALTRAGFRRRLRLDLAGSGLGEAVRAGGWMLAYVCCTQLGFVLTANLANRAGAVSATAAAGTGAGLSSYNYAYQLFQLPYAVIGVSLITALLPKMSAHVADGRLDDLRTEFHAGARLAALAMIPASLALAMLAAPLAQLVFARGATSAADAATIGHILVVLALGLPLFTLFQLMLRVFYALGDTRTPALLAAANLCVHAIVAVSASALLPADRVVVGIAAGLMCSYGSGCVIAGVVLRRRVSGFSIGPIAGLLARLYVAATPLIGAGVLAAWSSADRGALIAFLAIAGACLLGLPPAYMAARALGVREVDPLLSGAWRRLRGRQ
ncbi:murein biosynthesis integral membrane protein MurJ [Sinosporangium siamense]|nr:murein biosynthesis integral membrane protein MurJ [Sinosporangium siamense]